MLEPIRHILSQQRIILASGSPRRQELLKMIGLSFETVPSKFEENLDKSSFSHPCEYVKENAKQKAIEVWNRLTLASNLQRARGDDHPSSSNSDDIKQNSRCPDLVIGADTVVTLEGELMEILEKPRNAEEAHEMLSKLSGQKHTVFTGVALVTKTKQVRQLGHHNSQPSSLESHRVSQTDQQGGAHSLTTDYVSSAHQAEQQQDYLVTTFHESTDVIMTELSNDIIRGYIGTGEPMDKAGAYAIQANGATIVEQIKGDFYNVVGLPIHRLCRELYILHCDL